MSSTPPSPSPDHPSELQRPSQDVRNPVDAVDVCSPVRRRGPRLFEDCLDIAEVSQPATLPSTSPDMPGSSTNDCAVNRLSSPVPVPNNRSADAEELPPNRIPKFRIVNERARQYRNYELMAREVTVQIDPPQPHENPYEWLQDTFTELTNHLLNDTIAPHDRVGFTLHSAARVNQRPIGLSLRRRDQFSVDVLLQLIERCVQSNEEFCIAGPLQVVFLNVRVPITGGRNSPINNSSSASKIATSFKRRRGIITITNQDNLCLARALVVAIAFVKKDESAEAKRYYNYVRVCNPARRQNRQTADARRLCEQVDVDLTQNGGGINELERFQEYLKEYTITVFTDVRRRETMFQGPPGTPTHPRKNICLIFENNHYNVITSINGL